MSRLLAIGYVANVLIILASLLVARKGFPGLEHGSAFAVSQGVLILLLPAGLITRAGMVRSQGKLRKTLALSVVILDVVLALGGLLALALVLFANARVVA